MKVVSIHQTRSIDRKARARDPGTCCCCCFAMAIIEGPHCRIVLYCGRLRLKTHVPLSKPREMLACSNGWPRKRPVVEIVVLIVDGQTLQHPVLSSLPSRKAMALPIASLLHVIKITDTLLQKVSKRKTSRTFGTIEMDSGAQDGGHVQPCEAWYFMVQKAVVCLHFRLAFCAKANNDTVSQCFEQLLRPTPTPEACSRIEMRKLFPHLGTQRQRRIVGVQNISKFGFDGCMHDELRMSRVRDGRRDVLRCHYPYCCDSGC